MLNPCQVESKIPLRGRRLTGWVQNTLTRFLAEPYNVNGVNSAKPSKGANAPFGLHPEVGTSWRRQSDARLLTRRIRREDFANGC
jgi:hypothetical protein